MQQQHQYQLSAKFVEYYYDHPVEFVEDQILRSDETGIRCTAEQAGMLNYVRQIRDGELNNTAGEKIFGVSTHSGHGVGKTTGFAFLILWWLYVHPACKIPVTAVKKEQLGDNLWPEMKKWIDHSTLRDDYEWQKTKVYLKNKEESVFAIARTGSSPDALQGFHSEYLLYVVEEASGVEDVVFEPVEGALTGENGVMVLGGNPTKSSGYFTDSFTKDTRFKSIHIPCINERTGEIHSRVSPEYPPRIAKKYGKDSNVYRVRVGGLPPKTDDDAIIPWEWVNDATELDLELNPLYRRVWGVDVARYGSDSSALAKRCGKMVMEPVKTWKNKETTQIAGLIFAEFRDTPKHLRPNDIFVDEIGVGAGVTDMLIEKGLPVTGVTVSRSPAMKEKHHRLRDELWWRAREWFEDRDVSIPNDEDLIAELTTPKYKIPSDGKTHVEAKDEFKKRLPLIGSPDRADAFVLTMMDSMELIEDHAVDEWETHEEYGGNTTWMSA